MLSIALKFYKKKSVLDYDLVFYLSVIDITYEKRHTCVKINGN